MAQAETEPDESAEIRPIVVHGNWLVDRARFFVWAESKSPEGRPARSTNAPQIHPFSLPAQELHARLIALLFSEEGTRPTMEDARVALPADAAGPYASFEDPAERGRRKNGTVLTPYRVEGLGLGRMDALGFLVSLPGSGDAAGQVSFGADMLYWSSVCKLAVELLARERFLPFVSKTTQGNGHLRAAWRPVLDEEGDRRRFAALAQAMPPLCRTYLPETAESKNATPSHPTGRDSDGRSEHAWPNPGEVLKHFFETVTDSFIRRATVGIPLQRDLSDPLNPAHAWLSSLLRPTADESRDGGPAGSDSGELFAWASSLAPGGGGSPFRTCLRLEPPEEYRAPRRRGRRTRGAEPPWTLRFFMQAADDPSLLVPGGAIWRAAGSALTYFDRRIEQPQEKLLGDLGHASRMFPPIERGLRLPRPVFVYLRTGEAYTFLREAAWLLQQSGFGVLVPSWWDPIGMHGPRPGVRLRVMQSARGAGDTLLGLDSIVEFDWQLVLGGEPITKQDFEALAELKVPLVRVRGQWVELRPEEVQAALRFWSSRSARGEMTLREFLRLGLGQAELQREGVGMAVAGFEAEGHLKELMDGLRDEARVVELGAPASLQGQLRPYQLRGYSWLAFLKEWGLGACLADDMGLGKTVQLISLVLREREKDGTRTPVLVVCPTSVMGNWEKEIIKFAPSLRVLLHHGAGRKKDEEFIAEAGQHDLVVTTYSLLHRDEAFLKGIEWSVLVLDEAQNIKNPWAKQSQAARSLPGRFRVALTGTPVENRLAELWSILNFLNPAYLGGEKEFRSRFAVPIERYQNREAGDRLRRLVRPFVLRRLKTDPTIIADLPTKTEMKVYCTLTREQATLYRAVVKDMIEQIQDAEGIKRKGLVLAALTKLKQVCNHPAQFLKDKPRREAADRRSGKLARLIEMLEEALSEGDRSLIFTQFAQMGALLVEALERAFGGEVLFLHGGVPRPAREKMIARFQAEDGAKGPPLFVLSLKAGGFGLNLTRANRVFHFDRWWNPAVENQATDRAYRIGQTQNVLVHKFLCRGTLEERIDEMIERKKSLAENIIGAGEAWITELSTNEIKELFALREEAVVEE